ncbi:hypothetical protein DDB_G0293776 [Dictyostelium discoideum AX4]|uniref:Putative uncharacterized protein DDB_G0293776 n=1 Tax=Dictyostelium discoideum TaxID=44689 RepID=Y2116_DICDI|nr:hypothetical protein DDB_G0293776 [Dictyostelium discoideum AX4]Q54BB3.1 RecName: Full=Putative uncharacterized protein DDB_G0293776 [Dictyostelium discoideum]EAL60565.1 hypothetical protein DDB_G0293776 [Dictyostelium discoideum AX4]|eukprot:XP_628981.1 hypothetical protein DDB_G0293776 [Dictyostelium discoideum AX4]
MEDFNPTTLNSPKLSRFINYSFISNNNNDKIIFYKYAISEPSYFRRITFRETPIDIDLKFPLNPFQGIFFKNPSIHH